MNRSNEYDALLRQLEQTPPELEYTVQRVKRRARHRRRGWLAPPTAAAALFAVFVVLINTNVSFASSVENIPVLRNIAAAVSWSKPLSDVVDNGDYQVICQEQAAGELTMAMDYAIVDRTQLNLIYSASYSADPTVRFRVKDLNLSPAVHFGAMFDSLSEPWIIPVRLYQNDLPEQLTVTLTLEAVADTDLWLTDEAIASETFTFELDLDPALLSNTESFPIGQWIEVGDHRAWVDRLDIYPTGAQLIVREDEEDTAWFRGLHFYLEDGTGKIYEATRPGRGFGYFEQVDDHTKVFYAETPWYAEDKALTLHITAAAWQDKDCLNVTIDTQNGTASGLPEGITYAGMEYLADRDETHFRFKAAMPNTLPTDHPLRYALINRYKDGDGYAWSAQGMGASLPNEDGSVITTLYVPGSYEFDTFIGYLNLTCWDYQLDLSIPITD